MKKKKLSNRTIEEMFQDYPGILDSCNPEDLISIGAAKIKIGHLLYLLEGRFWKWSPHTNTMDECFREALIALATIKYVHDAPTHFSNISNNFIPNTHLKN